MQASFFCVDGRDGGGGDSGRGGCDGGRVAVFYVAKCVALWLVILDQIGVGRNMRGTIPVDE